MNLLADGNILASGIFIALNNQPRLRLAKLTQTGLLDNTFNAAISTSGIVHAIKRQPDGKILIGGNFKYVNGVRTRSVARLNSDGSLDDTFNIAGIIGDVYAFEIQPDGKIIIGGFFGGDASFPANGAARLNSDGSLDVNLGRTVTPPLVEVSAAYALAIQPDGKILVAGSVFFTGETTIVRFNPNGTVDPLLLRRFFWSEFQPVSIDIRAAGRQDRCRRVV